MALPAGNRAIGAAFDLRRRIAPHKKAQLCRVFLYPDPAPVGRDIRVSKGGFKGTVLRI